MRYDPLVAPQATRWLRVAEAERLGAIEAYHRGTAARAPNLRLHAILHAIVETQLATQEASVSQALERLISEGLDRHEAIHAIGSVLSEQIYGALRPAAAVSDPAAGGSNVADAGPNAADDYTRKLDSLSAKTWKRVS